MATVFSGIMGTAMTHQLNDELKAKTIEYPEGFRFGAGDDVIVSSEVLQKYLTSQKQALLDEVEGKLPKEIRHSEPFTVPPNEWKQELRERTVRNGVIDDTVSAIKKIREEL